MKYSTYSLVGVVLFALIQNSNFLSPGFANGSFGSRMKLDLSPNEIFNGLVNVLLPSRLRETKVEKSPLRTMKYLLVELSVELELSDA